MKFTTWLRRITIALSSFGLMTLPAQADDTSSQSYELDIDALPLTAAVKTLSDETGVEVLFFSEIAEGVTSSPVQGEYTPTEALETMLNSTGLKVVDLKKEGAVAIATTASDERGASDSKNLNPQPVLMAQNSSQTGTSQTQTTSSRSEDGGTGIVTGKVTDARTGANLKGAKVTVEETGQWTSTNDLGEFRFVNVPTGSATLTVSYLGYAGQASVVDVRGDGTSQNFALRGGSEIEEIVVFGQRSARALALNQERTSDVVSTVVSNDLLGTFPGSTISDVLRGVPGVAFVPDTRTGEGGNIIIRGLEPDLNAVKVNGIELPEGTGLGRSASLNNILAASVDKVTISKTLLPSQDSSGTGGLVEIETKTPFDRPKRFANIAYEQLLDNSFQDERIAVGTLSGIFGSQERFGASVSLQYRDSQKQSATWGQSLQAGLYLPLSPAGTPTISSPGLINPLTSFPFEAGADQFYATGATYSLANSKVENIGVNVTGEYRSGAHSLELAYQLSEANVDSYAATASFSAPLQYALLPVVALGGQERYVLESRDFYRLSHSYGWSESEDRTEVVTLRGRSEANKWAIDYVLGYTDGSSKTPTDSVFGFSPPTSAVIGFDTYLSSSAVDETEGRVISLFPQLDGARLPVPRLTGEGYAFLNDPANHSLSSVFTSSRGGENTRKVAELNVSREFGQSKLKGLDIGVSYEESEFRNDSNPVTVIHDELDGVFARDLGFEFSAFPESEMGFSSNGFSVASVDEVMGFLGNLDRFSASIPALLTRSISDRREFFPNGVIPAEFTEEEELATYIQARLQFGRLDVVGGARVSRVDINAVRLVTPALFDVGFAFDPVFSEERLRAAPGRASQTEILPRLAATYRFNEDVMLRAAYFRSVARPSIGTISADLNYAIFLDPIFGPNFDQPFIQISEGNPDLQPATTDSYDISLEYYLQNGGVLKVGAFYKDIKDPIRVDIEGLDEVPTSFVYPDDPRVQAQIGNFAASYSQPVNSPFDDLLWGLETAVELQFTKLPGLWSGFGVYANATYTQGETDEVVTWSSRPTFDELGNITDTDSVKLVAKDRALTQQPELSYTVAATYNLSGFDGRIAYTYQDRRRGGLFSQFNLTTFRPEFDSLDARLEYRFAILHSDARIYFEANDLLRSDRDESIRINRGGEGDTRSVPIGETYRGGRSFVLGFGVVFD